jgi:hypothetical protein
MVGNLNVRSVSTSQPMAPNPGIKAIAGVVALLDIDGVEPGQLAALSTG